MTFVTELVYIRPDKIYIYNIRRYNTVIPYKGYKCYQLYIANLSKFLHTVYLWPFLSIIYDKQNLDLGQMMYFSYIFSHCNFQAATVHMAPVRGRSSDPVQL